MYKIIIADDDVKFLEQFKRITDWEKYDMSVAASFDNAEDVLDYVKNNIVDAIITDIAMPDMTGLDIAKYIYDNYPDVIGILKSCGICYSRTTEATESLIKTFPPKNWLAMPTTCKYDNPKLMELANEFANRTPADYEGLFVFYVWGHSWELECNNHWGIMEDFASVAGNRGDVWYAANIELYDYVKAFGALQKSADGDIVYNPTDKKLWFEVGGKVLTVASGETVDLRSLK